MKKVENYLETLKLKKCLFGGIVIIPGLWPTPAAV